MADGTRIPCSPNSHPTHDRDYNPFASGSPFGLNQQDLRPAYTQSGLWTRMRPAHGGRTECPV